MIYADFNGSAPICDDVKSYLINRLENGPYANPNAIHQMGTKVLMGMENARAVCAKILGADYNQIIFNSGATEGLSHIFSSVLERVKGTQRNIIIISGIEHSAVVNLADHYIPQDFEKRVVPTLPNGIIDTKTLQKWVEEDGEKIALISIMAANNETGVIQPYQEIAKLSHQAGSKFLCDTTQFIGKTLYNFKNSGVDFAVMSGHKIGALTGSGLILAKEPTELTPFIIGGGQERGLRGGTQNYIGNETLAVALTSFEKKLDNIESLNSKRIEFESKLKEKFPEVVIIGEDSPRLATTTYIAYPGIHGQAVQIELESQNIFVTTSSACSDNEPVTSKVLKSMGVSDDIGRGVVRISLGLCAPLEAYDVVFEALCKSYEKLAKIKSY